MGKLGRFLAEAFFPTDFTCDICGIETFGGNLCPDCKKTVTFNDGFTCPVCGRKNFYAEICMECKARVPLFKKAVSPLVYEGGSTVLIAKFKNGEGYLKEYFADLIAKKLTEFNELNCITFVPMTKDAVRARGYNQAELLAKAVSKRLDLPLVSAVVKQKNTEAQKTLSRKEREQNLKGCFKVEKRPDIKGKNILLIDDVLTTGATADAVCKKLLDAGAERVFLATVASVEYKAQN